MLSDFFSQSEMKYNNNEKLKLCPHTHIIQAQDMQMHVEKIFLLNKLEVNSFKK